MRAAGIHFANVLRRLRAYPNGAAAMLALAQESAPGALGCTQITEIPYTDGVTLVGALPDDFGLATTYSAAVASRAEQSALARRFVALLAGPETQALRAVGGFE